MKNKQLKITARSAQENIAALPRECLSINLLTREIIRVTAGESGYYTVKSQPEDYRRIDYLDKATQNKYVNDLNARDGITPAQREAMDNGSMFGWETPAANIENYNDDGTFKTVGKQALAVA